MYPAAVLLFDIDGTLIRRAGPQHGQALIDAVRAVGGIESSLNCIETQGMLDPDILRRMMRNAGLEDSAIEGLMPGIVTLAQELYECPSLEEKVCPGVYALFEELHRQQFPAGLVTGNLSEIAWRKMKAANLRHHFRFGAFAEMAETRAGLVGIALQQARDSNWIGPATQAILFGDHPNDVNAAKLNGICSVAVATGISSFEELAACSPDLLVMDLCSLDLAALLRDESFARA